MPLEAYLAGVIKDLSVYSSRAPAGISLRYPFGEPYTGLQKQRVHLRRGAVTRPLLKFHKLTVTVRETDLFDRQVVAGLENHVASRQFAACSDEDRTYLHERIGELKLDPTSDLAKLRRVVDTQTQANCLDRPLLRLYRRTLPASPLVVAKGAKLAPIGAHVVSTGVVHAPLPRIIPA